MGLALSIASLWLGTWDAFWQLVTVPVEQRAAYTWTLSILFLLAGFFVSIISVVKENHNHIEIINNTIQTTLHQTRNASTVTPISSDEAFSELIHKIGAAEVIWNTRVSRRIPKESYPSRPGQSYWKAVEETVKKGTEYREIADPSWGEVLLSSGLINYSENVDISILQNGLDAFLNFIVLEYADGQYETYFGWTVTRKSAASQVCFHTRNTQLARLLISFHNDIFISGIHLDEWSITKTA